MASPYLIGGHIGAMINNADNVAQHKLGTVDKGSDGHEFIYVQATTALANGATVIITEPAFTAAAGAGPWTVQAVAPGVVANQCFWARRATL
jgi:hypothetical protein